MKIAIDCRMINMSGIGSYLRGLLKYFIAIEENQYILLGNRKELDIYKTNRNCIIKHIDIPIFSVKELICFPVNIINTCDCFYTPNYNIPLGIKIPIYATIHDVVFLDIPSLTSYLGRLIRYVYLKRSYIISKVIFTVSEFSKQRILEHLCKSYDKVIVTYNGVSESFLNYTSNERKKDYFLYVGNIKAHKGIKTLLSAFNKLRLYDSKARLVVIGDYHNFQTTDKEIQQLINTQMTSKELIFTGKVDDDNLKKIMFGAKALIQPSLYEGFGIPPLESMYLGTPVILSDIPVFKELYSDFPVTKFHVNDVNDLYEKMKMAKGDRVVLSSQQKMKYSYQNSAKLIIKTFISQ